MLSALKQQNYFVMRHAKTKRLLTAFASMGNLEDLHRLRVEIKKTRAFFHLLKRCNTTNSYKQYAEGLRPIFASAGRIRYKQVTQQLLENLKGRRMPGNLAKTIDHLESKKLLTKSNEIIKQLDVNAEVLKSHFKNISAKKIIRYYESQLKKTVKVFSQNTSKKEWHKTRMRIKRLIYLYELLPVSVTRKLQLDIPYLKKLEDSIGKWHDLAAITLPKGKRSFINEQTEEKLKDKLKHQEERVVKLSRSLTKT